MSDGFERVCSLAELHAAPRCRLAAKLRSGRRVILVEAGGRLAAMDHACYHHGGPLLDADIEELGGHNCIVCPWHKYKLSLETGECLYIGLNMETGEQAVKSKGLKQRVHEVAVRPSGEGGAEEVWVRDAGANGEAAAVTVASDAYAKMEINPAGGAGPGGPGPRGLMSGGGGSVVGGPGAVPLHSSFAPWAGLKR